MKQSSVALAFLLLFGIASADYVAYFSGQAAASAISADRTSFPGHYGDYTVEIGVYPPPLYVRVTGSEASKAALVSELEWLKENGVIVSNCSLAEIANISDEAGYYCNETQLFVPCSTVSFCEPGEPVPPAVPQQNAPGGAQETIGQAANGVLDVFGQQKMATASRENAPQPPQNAGGQGAPAAQGITLEQFAQLLGAFILVIIASYLILQQRQVQVEPQEERLLQNETRAGIMEQLAAADKIPTDLSAKLGKSKATIVEHLETLSQAGFVERLETPGRKFVYYRLTHKGRQAVLRRAG